MPNISPVFWVAIVTASAVFCAIGILVLKPILVRHMLAHPNARSSHKTPTPQGAGFAVMAGVLAISAGALLLVPLPGPSLVPVLVGAGALTLIGGLDDAHALSVAWRLLAQTLIAAGVVFMLPSDFQVLPDFLPIGPERALLVVGVVGLVNAVNFLDGLDWMTVAQVVPMTLGVAILCLIGAVSLSVGLLALALLGAILGFAWFNKHPAQIFLGDAGSLPIGLVLAFLVTCVAEAHIVSAILLALYTLADSAVTLIRRLRAGEHIFSAHRSHFYQRAVAAGLLVPQVTARVFWLGIWLMTLAIAAAHARALVIDITTLLMGLGGTALVLFNLTKKR
jgi:UDP-N-acetylmuramyl pentapeptide phosphotransferase/UDP-N-acetylglucosamine-1-phosphate transferase